MADILYAEVALVCTVVISIIHNRTRVSYENSKAGKAFLDLLIFSIFFCFVDAVWDAMRPMRCFPSAEPDSMLQRSDSISCLPSVLSCGSAI